MENAICDVEHLGRALPLSPEEREEISRVLLRYPMRITPYYLSLIQDPRDPSDPVRLQAVPRAGELEERGEEDLYLIHI